MIEFKLERFAEEDSVSEMTDSDVKTEELPPIPSELDGLPEDIAREAMAEAEELAQSKESAANETDKSTHSPQTYTYEQYKAKDDELNALKAQFDEYKRRNEQPQPRQPPVNQPQIRFTPEIANALKSAVEQEAMKMTGLTKEDLASFDYADEGDVRVETFKYAKDIARNNILSAIQQENANRMAQARQFLQQHEASVKSYNEFATKEMSDANFEQVKSYATGEYFNKLDPQDQIAVRGAYYRIERQTAEPTDIALVKNYFKQAKADYLSKVNNNAPKQNAVEKIKQANALPKVDQISGTTTSSGEISIAELERMLNESEDVTKIPEKYRKIMAGY